MALYIANQTTIAVKDETEDVILQQTSAAAPVRALGL